MDIATAIGIVLGFGLIFVSILLGGSIGAFIDIQSAVVVAGGTVAAILIAFPLGHVVRLFNVFRQTLFARPPDAVENVKALVRLAEVARRDGILSLESHVNDGGYDPFLTSGLRMAIDGQDPGVIEAALEQELQSVMDRHAEGRALFETMGKYAPAFGMIGTLIGLVLMLGNLSDLDSLGPAMAVALITTFYGSVIANAFALPLADKLALRSTQEVASKMLILRGVMSIQAGDNPRVVQQKLMAFLDPPQRKRVDEGGD